jgi:putative ABC transport system permease protein
MFLALKEMRRAKLRFGLLIGAVGLLVFLMLFISSLTSSLITQFIGAIRNQSADVIVFSDQARRNLEGSVITPDQYAAIEATAEPIGATVGRLGEGTFTVTAGGDDTDAVLFGYDLGGPGEPTTLVSGRLPETDFEAVASERNRSEGFDVGDTIRLEPDGADITIVGLARDINYSVSPTMFVSFETYEAARKTRNPDAQVVYPSVAVIEEGPGGAQEAVDAVEGSVSGVLALTRQEAVDSSPGVSAVRQSLTTVVYVAGLIVVIVSGFFFVILTVQKAQSLTLLRAIGAPARTLVTSLLLQVFVVVGGGIVVAVGLLGLARLGTGGSDVAVVFEPGSILATSAVILVLSTLASWGAIRRVLRIDPIRATQPGGVNA